MRPGLADPVLDGQGVFRAVLDALARPGVARSLPAAPPAPAPLTPELAAIALALADPDAPLWLDPVLAASAEVTAYLRFHTGAAIVADQAASTFALVADPGRLLAFAEFCQGEPEYPDRSTTIVLAVPSLAGGPAIRLAGPGIATEIEIAPAGLPADFAARLAQNRALYPLGIDLLLVAGGEVLGIPRSSRVVRGETILPVAPAREAA